MKWPGVYTQEIKLIHGDCLEKMKDIPDGSIDLILTDPPYKVISGGTDNHSMLIDLRTKFPEITGKVVENILVKRNTPSWSIN